MLTDSDIASAIARAVPLGASSFWLWCFSMISISKLFSSSRAALQAKSIRRLMPIDMFAEKNMGADFAASAILAFCSSLRPVVQMTAGVFVLTAQSIIPSNADGCEKSMITSNSSLTSPGFA